MGFTNNKKVGRRDNNKRKIGNGKSTLVNSKFGRRASPKPPPVATAPAAAAAAAVLPARSSTPPMPPLQSTRKARCEALMDKCPYPGIECNRHKCSSCGMYCHAIEPCSKEVSPRIFHCGVCMNLKSDSEEEDVEPTDESPDMLATQKDSYDDDDTDEEVVVAAAVDPNKKKKADMEQLSQFLNNTQKQEKKTRGKNFTSEEDLFVTEAWCTSTEDSRSGSDQKQADFNKKFFSNYVSKVDDHNEYYKEQLSRDRQQRSVVNRFGVIKHATNKLIGIVNQNPIRSGETPEDHKARCLEMYEHAVGSKFNFIECYYVLKDFPKLSAAKETGRKGSDGKKHVKKPRGTGKRQQALDDKIQHFIDSNGANEGKSAMKEAVSVSEAIGQISTHLVDQVSVLQWSDADKEEYFKNNAMEKKLLQKRSILWLQKEIVSMEKEDSKEEETSENSED
ncbi:unknown protein [Seminavis robusta]|uniref:Uncharacterized protein n=1 Tax=Seminavis robusta TaxID=568900 RepID=A0A9N8HWG6_9STRA|nr:unknown protein [Seminavis robusta]|eukprot:Sro2209_g319190.1 n/a (449) ;mRNA; f:14103-15449